MELVDLVIREVGMRFLLASKNDQSVGRNEYGVFVGARVPDIGSRCSRVWGRDGFACLDEGCAHSNMAGKCVQQAEVKAWSTCLYE